MAIAKVGEPAPDFTMAIAKPGDTARTVDKSGKVSLADYKGKWLVFFFYPLDFTFVCPTEITALSDRFDEFEEIGADSSRLFHRLDLLASGVDESAPRQGRPGRNEVPACR